MPLLLVEPIVKGVKTLLTTDLDSYLTTIEATHTGDDAIAIDRPRNPEAYYLSQKFVFELWPSIVILAETSGHGHVTQFAEYFTQEEGGGGHEISITYIDRHDDEEKLRLTLYRVALAINRIIADNRTLGGAAMYVQVDNDEYFPAVRLGTLDAFTQAVQIRLTVQTEEAI